MGCCGGSNNQSDKHMKEWGNEENKDQTGIKQNPMLIIVVLLFLGLIVYKFVI